MVSRAIGKVWSHPRVRRSACASSALHRRQPGRQLASTIRRSGRLRIEMMCITTSAGAPHFAQRLFSGRARYADAARAHALSYPRLAALGRVSFRGRVARQTHRSPFSTSRPQLHSLFILQAIDAPTRRASHVGAMAARVSARCHVTRRRSRYATGRSAAWPSTATAPAAIDVPEFLVRTTRT